MRADIYNQITDKIVADLEKGVRPWFKPWSAGNTEGRIVRPRRVTGEPYKGINVLWLWATADTNGYGSPTWMTYRQATELGGQVRKGEKGTLSVYADRFRKTETNDKGEEIERDIPFLKGYAVFNCDQIDNLPERFRAKPEPKPQAWERDEKFEAFMANTGADIRHGGNRAYFSRASDHIQMPPREAFRDRESYGSTLSHEITHWAGSEKRLNRVFGKRFGDDDYGREELVGELGAAFLCADLGITPEVREDHASYIDHWLKVLKADKRAIFSAAAHAQRAADYLHGLQPGHAPEPSRPAVNAPQAPEPTP